MTLLTQIKWEQYTAFQKAYHEYHAQSFRSFLRRIRTEGLTEPSFIKFWQSRQTLHASYALYHPMFTIANSILIDYPRKQAVERKRWQQLGKKSDREFSLIYRAISNHPVMLFEYTTN